MKFATIFAALVGSAAALTTPASTRRSTALSNVRPASHRLLRARPARAANAHTFAAAAAESTESTQAGAVLGAANITSVSGTFAVPSPEMPTTGPTGGNVVGLYGASFWVGIDGATAGTCSQASLRAGVDIFWDQGMQTAVTWYQWAPGQTTDFGNFSVTPGDRVRITARATGSTCGVVTAENLGPAGGATAQAALQTATQSFTNQAPALCRAEASWMIEDFPLMDSPSFPVALVNFSSVTFEDLEVKSATQGAVRGAAGAKLANIDLEEQGGQLTDCRVLDSGDVQCARIVENP